MSIAKTFEVIADAVYEKGKADGGGVDLSKCKYIEKSAVGKFIILTDVSEVAHKVKVVGVGNEVDVYGANLCDYTKFVGISAVDKANVILDGDTFIFPAGNSYYGLNMTNGLPLVKGQTYAVSYGAITPYAYPELQVIYTDNTKTVFGNGTIKTIEKDIKEIRFYINGGTLAETDIKLSKFQVALGACVVDYELPTKQTITATPIGTEIPSMCPNMTFIADEEIQVNYYSSFGMQTEYDRFWDVYQNYGNRTNYANAFAGLGWNDQVFKPKYDIVLVLGAGGSLFNSALVTDIGKTLKDCGVTLDTSRATNMSYAFASVKTKTLPLLDFSSATVALTDTLANCTELHTIDGMVFSENTNIASSLFRNDSKLTHCIFSGVIASDINLQWSPLLDEESLVSLLYTMKSNAGYVTTITLSPESWDKLDALPPETWGDSEDARNYVSHKGWFFA